MLNLPFTEQWQNIGHESRYIANTCIHAYVNGQNTAKVLSTNTLYRKSMQRDIQCL